MKRRQGGEGGAVSEKEPNVPKLITTYLAYV